MSFVHRIEELVAEQGNGLTEKAPHWERIPLGRVAQVINGYPFPSKGFQSEGGEPVVRIRDILPGEAGTFYQGPHDEAPSLEHGELVVGMDGDFNARLWPGQKALLNQRVCKIVPNRSVYSNAFLAYVLPGYLKLINDHTSAVTVKHLSSQTIQEIPLPLPPRAEQDRLVSRLDELFSEIEAGERALERVQKLVGRYRQSVLKAAVTGELTREWREKQKGQLESGEALLARILKARGEARERIKGDRPPAEVVSDYLHKLPSEWQKVRVDSVGEVQLGRQRAPAHHSGAHMRPYLRVANVFEERIDVSDVMEMNFTPEEFATYSLVSGDILLNEGQSKELVGRPAIYRGELPGGCFTNTLVRFRAFGIVLPEFALLVFLHFMKSGDFQKIARITTNIAHLGAGRFAEMAFPVPSLEEQRVIVDEARRLTTALAHLGTDIGSRLRVARSLRQSVLKAAFSGSLVQQESTGEPALALLKRVSDERNTASASPTRQRRKSTTP